MMNKSKTSLFIKIFYVITWNKSVVYKLYLLSFTKECILDLLTLFYERLIQTISCWLEWVDVRDKWNFRTGSLWLYVYGSEFSSKKKTIPGTDIYFILSIKQVLDWLGLGAPFLKTKKKSPPCKEMQSLFQ